MPYSPFARFLAIVIVAIFALALLWPDDRAQLWGLYSLGALPLIVGVFTWNVVRSAAPYDDRAFHRCLPPGPGHAYLRMLWIHLLVLAGVALTVLIYCWLHNFGWRAMSYGIVLLTLPLWAFISATGLASSMAATNQHWRSPAWVSIFTAPIFSWALLYWARTGMLPEDEREVYLTPVRTIALTAAVVYPLIWWLAAVPRRRPLGMIFGAATGALLPWLYVYGDFVKAPDRQERNNRMLARQHERPSPIKLTRKPVPDGADNWIPVSDLVDVDGLKDGQHVAVNLYAEWSADEKGRDYLNALEVRDEKVPDQGGIRYTEAMAYRKDGKILWGQDPVWQDMLSQIPPHDRFGYWDTSLNRPTSPPVILRPGVSIPRSQRAGEERRPFQYSRLTPELFKSSPWKAWITPPMRWLLLGSSETKSSAKFKPSNGGAIKVEALKETENGHHVVQMHYYSERLWEDGALWFGHDQDSEERGWLDPSWLGLRILIADESGKQIYAVDRYGLNDPKPDKKVFLGRRISFLFDAGVADSPEQIKRIEMLRRGRIYVFTASVEGSPAHAELPPP